MNLNKELIKLSDMTHGRINRTQVFSDFLAYGALLLGMRTDPVHSKNYAEQFESLHKNYTASEWDTFHQGLVTLSNHVVENSQMGCFTDLFADTYQAIGAQSRAMKQDFTPASIGKLMAAIVLPEHPTLPECGYFTLNDPTCGSGTLLLHFAELYAQRGFNPSSQLVAQAADLDIRCVYMAYLNLSLYGIPAVIVHGNTITLQEFSRWYTPSYLLGKWVWREPMPFGKEGYETDEKLKMLDEPLYRAIRLMSVDCPTNEEGDDCNKICIESEATT